MKFLKLLAYTVPIFSIFFVYGCGGSYTETEIVSSEPVTIETFKESLNPDGEWIKITKEEIDSDGVVGEQTGFVDEDINVEYIWRPNPIYIYTGWNPYTNGRWIWTDWGWMWASNFDWGWATYHYGRWWWSGVYGWVWSPGYRWAPAWVTWRFAENHIGWYPLSPRISLYAGISNINYNYRNENWTFVERNNFTRTIDNNTIVNVSKNEEIVADSKHVMNIKQQNNKIINTGPDVKNIEKSTGENITQRTINETSVKGKPTVNENSVSVYKGTNKSTSKNKGKNKNKNNKGNEEKDNSNEQKKHHE
jgi:hypothetical protein